MARSGPALVADASVVVKWFLKEEFSADALRVRASHTSMESRIVVPTLARYEVLNALRHSGRFGREDLARASKELEGIGLVEVTPDQGDWEEALRIAADHGLTVYDSCYLALGSTNHLPVYTADERVLERAGALGFLHHVKAYR